MEKKKDLKGGVYLALLCTFVSLGVLVWAIYAQVDGHRNMEEYPKGYIPGDYTGFIFGSLVGILIFANALVYELKDYKQKKRDAKKQFLNKNLQT